MINPKVKAIYRNIGSSGTTSYGGVDLTDYSNDIKNYSRKLEVFRTDTGALIFTEMLTKGTYFSSRTVQDGVYPSSPYLEDLPIKAVLTIRGADGVDIVVEDSVSFMSKDTEVAYGNAGLPRRSEYAGDSFFSVVDQSVYPSRTGRLISDFLRYTVVSRRATSLPVSDKIEYIKEFIGTNQTIEFKYFNEYVVIYKLVWIHRATNQFYEFSDGGYVNMNSELDDLYSAAGIYEGAAGHDPLANEDAAPDLTVLVPTTPTNPGDPASGDGLKDISTALRVAYIAKLAGLSYEGVQVPVYDGFAPTAAPDYFVVIKSLVEADDSLKGMFNTEMHVTLDIVTRFPADYGSSIVVDAISNSINGIICTNNYPLRLNLKPDFNVMNSIRTMSRPITEQSKTYNVFRKVNIYKHEIQQL